MEPGSLGDVALKKRALLLEIFSAALEAADPYRAVTRALWMSEGKLFAGGKPCNLAAFDRIIVIGAGKATARMAEAVEETLGNAVSGGIIIVKYGHTARLRIVEQVEAAHPIPDESGVRGTERILELVRRADEKTLVLCLLSGGGSALLVAPRRGITLEDKQRTTDLLLRAGANIRELNAVRKHLSAVKGGRLAQLAYPAEIVTLILSDVIGDRLDVIASGPTAPDRTTFDEALSTITKYGLKEALPPRVVSFLENGIEGREPETAKADDTCFQKTRNVIIGGNTQALSAACRKAKELGYDAEIVSSELQGEVREAVPVLVASAFRVQDSMKPGERRCLLFGGETTVTVLGTGKGGRNQELALAFALQIAGREGITFLSAGTDGTDGPTGAAGAAVDGHTAEKARACGIHPETYLVNNDSYGFFSKLDSACDAKHHVITGPTGTNVMDIQAILVEK
jgi:glycerate 2-kinase